MLIAGWYVNTTKGLPNPVAQQHASGPIPLARLGVPDTSGRGSVTVEAC